MPTPLHLKPPMAAWITRESRRLGLKPADIATRLRAMGLSASEGTVRVWQANGDRRPGPENLDGLERIFGSKAPTAATPSPDLSALVEALHRQTDALTVLTEEAAERQRAMVIEAVRGELAPLWETVRELERALAAGQPRDAELHARR